MQAFEADRAGRGPLLVLWDQRDPFDGEDQPPVTVTWPWPEGTAAAVTDAFGRSWTLPSQDGQLRLPVTDTPLLIEPVEPVNTGRGGSHVDHTYFRERAALWTVGKLPAWEGGHHAPDVRAALPGA